jgi:ABC-type branched-subunit amino acid transport system substrate-binding protein
MICIISFSLFSCSLKHIVSTPPVKIDQGEALFLKAEKFFEKGVHDLALSSYQEYLFLFSEASFAPAALMKIGTIHMALGNHAEARVNFKRLVNTFAESVFVTDAKIKILFTYFNEGDYATVINDAQKLIQTQMAQDDLLAIYVLLGDSYAASNLSIDSVYYYSRAYVHASESNRKILIDKLKEPAANLNTTEVQSVLNLMDNKLLQGHFLYLIALSKAWYEKYEEALLILSKFVADFPGHQNILRANILIKEIENKSNYNHLTIGCLLPLTGAYKTYGNNALRGVELARNHFFSQHTGRPVNIIVKDTESDNTRSVQAVRELYEDKVAAIIGPIITSEAAGVEAQRLGIPMITITQKEGIADIGDYVFRNFFTPKMQVKTIVAYAFKKLGIERFAIFYPDDNYGNTFMHLFLDEVILYGGDVVGLESYSPDQTDFADSIKKLIGRNHEVSKSLKQDMFSNKQDGSLFYSDRVVENKNVKDEKNKETDVIVDFEAIFIPDDPKRVGLIIPQLAYYDVNGIYFFGTNLWHSGELIMMAKEYVQGAIMPDIFFEDSESQEVKLFVSDYESIYKEKPGFIEAAAYDTAMILFNMVSLPDISSRSSLKSELAKLKNYKGVTGLTSFDVNGEVVKKLYLLKIQGTHFKEVE